MNPGSFSPIPTATRGLQRHCPVFSAHGILSTVEGLRDSMSYAETIS